MRPLILMPTINSRHWNACYLQLLSVQRCQHPPQAERSCWGGGPDPPSSRALLLGGGPDPPSTRALLLGGGSAMTLDVQGGYRAVCGRSRAQSTHTARPPKRQGDTLTLRRRPCSDTNLVPF